MDGLRRFHQHLLRGRLSRHVERSPLPFGRHRWVSPDDAPDIEIAPAAPARNSVRGCEEQTNMPLDSNADPGGIWRSFRSPTAGTGLSLVISHGLTDGVGLRRRWPTRLPGRTIRSSGRPPDHAGGGAHCARTLARPHAICPPSAGRSAPRRGWPARDAVDAAPSRAGSRAGHGHGRTDRDADSDRLLRHEGVGSRAPIRSAGPATRCSQGWPRSWPTGGGRRGPATVWPPCRCPSMSASTVIPGRTQWVTWTSPSIRQGDQPTSGTSVPPSKRP